MTRYEQRPNLLLIRLPVTLAILLLKTRKRLSNILLVTYGINDRYYSAVPESQARVGSMTISFLLSPWFFHKKCAQRRINDLRSYHEYGNPPVAMPVTRAR